MKLLNKNRLEFANCTSQKREMALRMFWIFLIPAALSSDFDLTPRKPVSQVGDRLVLKCSVRSCQNAVFAWRTLQDQPLMHTSVIRASPNESHLVIHNVTLDHQTRIVCKADCGEGSSYQRSASVNVYSFPADPVVSGNDRLRPGEKNDLTCVVRDVYPAERLEIEWMQGNTVLNGTDEEDTDRHTDGATHTSVYSYTPRPEDKEKTITCRATLDLAGVPANQRTRETTVALTVKPLPLELDLEPSKPVTQVGDRLVLKCSVRSCQNAVFTWRTLQDQPLMHTSVIRASPNESRLVIHNVTLDHQTRIVCKADCGEGLTEEKAADVTVYSFPADPVVSGNDRLRPGEKNELTCVVRDVYPAEGLEIEWMKGDTVLNGTDEEDTDRHTDGATHTSVYSYTPRPEDKEKTITCRATLDLAGVPVNQRTRETTVDLTVKSRPRNTWVRVTPAGELMEGWSVLISCGSDSGPEGWVVLRRGSEGQETELQSSPSSSTTLTYTLPSIHLAHSGLYTCEASNQQGSEADSVWVQVHGSPRNTTVTALPSWQVQEGQNVTVSWRTASFPPASAVLRKEPGGRELFSRDGTFSLLHLTPADAGLYQLNVSNRLGYHTELLTLSVMGRRTSPPEDSRMLPKVLIPALGSGAMVTMAVLIIRYLWKMKGRAAYELAKDPMPMQGAPSIAHRLHSGTARTNVDDRVLGSAPLTPPAKMQA